MSLRARLEVPPILHADLDLPGGITLVVGENGAGKTTLLRALAGLAPAHGSLEVDGSDWSALPPHRRSVGLIPQEHALFPHLSARDNVAYPLRARGLRRRAAHAAALEWLERLGAAELAERRPDQLSGGQAQRVALARALAADPQVLLLDEPFAALDVTVAQALRADLPELVRGRTTLLVSHDPVDLFTLADQVLALAHGRVVQQASAAEAITDPADPHLARLAGSNVLSGVSAGTTVTVHETAVVTSTACDGPVLVTFSPTAVTLGVEEPHTSARNRWHTTVAGMHTHGEVVRVQLTQPPIRADLTPAAAAELALQPGSIVWASVKATETTVLATGAAAMTGATAADR